MTAITAGIVRNQPAGLRALVGERLAALAGEAPAIFIIK